MFYCWYLFDQNVVSFDPGHLAALGESFQAPVLMRLPEEVVEAFTGPQEASLTKTKSFFRGGMEENEDVD